MDLTILDEGERALSGWPSGATATVIDRGGHIQVVFVTDEIMGSVVVEKPIGKKNEPHELSPTQAEELAKKVLASISSRG